MCTIVPGGVVCFFPSYDYEKKVHTHWSQTGLLDRISKKKQVCSIHDPSEVMLKPSKFLFCYKIYRCSENPKWHPRLSTSSLSILVALRWVGVAHMRTPSSITCTYMYMSPLSSTQEEEEEEERELQGRSCCVSWVANLVKESTSQTILDG